MHRTVTRSLVLLALLALLGAACGGGQPATQDQAQDQDQTTDDGAEEDDADDMTGDAEAAVQVADSEFGEILTDADGMTLYMFEPDEGSGESTCTGGCAETWPPLTVEGQPTVASELDDSLVSTFEREDGSTQVVYNGHPLYRFAQDDAPGDTNGQGVSDVWWVVNPEGEPVQEAAEGSS